MNQTDPVSRADLIARAASDDFRRHLQIGHHAFAQSNGGCGSARREWTRDAASSGRAGV